MKRLIATLTCALALLLCAAVLSEAQTNSKSDQTTTTTKKAKKKSAQQTGKLDINSASQEELESLYGIGPVTARKIINNRPYSMKSDLVKRKIVSKGEYEDIRNNIVAHRTNKTK